ncbi:hypothetical protein DEO72_LG3g1969 [Vigna unguiculata]|uniref:Uncharacterized protein n=1 Tax=Vigna unguiculata TaxID=3917 RepID=A0A4D6LG16_VIGUN|nr:hypothetical protein DEO72_LG3g1969 [Vigna unguiculata]
MEGSSQNKLRSLWVGCAKQVGERTGVNAVEVPISDTPGLVCSKLKRVIRAPIISYSK